MSERQGDTMPDGEHPIDSYLTHLARRLQLPAAECDQVLAEVRTHLEERAAALHQNGISVEQAERQAVLAFGPVGRISRELRNSHPIAWGTRRWIVGMVTGAGVASALWLLSALPFNSYFYDALSRVPIPNQLWNSPLLNTELHGPTDLFVNGWLGGLWGLAVLVLYLVLPFVWGRRAQHWWVPGLAYGLSTGVPASLWPLYFMLTTIVHLQWVIFPTAIFSQLLFSIASVIAVALPLALSASFVGWWWREQSTSPPWRVLVSSEGAGGRRRSGAVRGVVSRLAPIAAVALIILLVAGLFFRVGLGAAQLDVGAAGSSTPLPGSQTTLQDISMVSPSEVWAVGQYHPSIDQAETQVLLMHLQGGVWSQVDVPISGYVNCVAMVSATDGWAGGTMGFLHYDGNTWTIAQTNLGWEPTHIQMLSATDGWAIGLPGVLAHYNGHRWTKQPLPAPLSGDDDLLFTGLSMSSPSDGWAIGNLMPGGSMSSTAVLLHYTNGHWEVGQRIEDANLQSISMVSTGNGWALGGKNNAIGGDLYHYSNGTWAKVESPIIGNPSVGELIVMRSATDGWIAYTLTSGGVPELLHYNGTDWSHVSLPLVMNQNTDSFEIHGLALTGANEAWAVGARVGNAHDSASLGGGSYIPAVTPMILRDSAGTWSVIED